MICYIFEVINMLKLYFINNIDVLIEYEDMKYRTKYSQRTSKYLYGI